jgi:Na+/melibiose symporter-like transporter
MTSPQAANPAPMTPELAGYYSDTRLRRRNLGALLTSTLGWQLAGTVLGPLMLLHLNSNGVGEGTIGLIGSLNSWLVAFLVMYFSWLSDRTRSRFGRRVPYFFISAPFIIVAMTLSPFIEHPASLIILYVVFVLFYDLKASTFPLLNIDLIPRDKLARTNSLFTILGGLMAFCSLQFGGKLADDHAQLLFLMGGGLMVATTCAALWIREPPVAIPERGTFRPWSALAIGLADRRLVVLMIGIALLNAVNILYNTWIWLYAKNVLGLERGEIAASLAWSPLLAVALAWPMGWLIDRVRGQYIVGIFAVIQIALAFALVHVQTRTDIVMAAIIQTGAAPLFYAAELLVVRRAPAEHVGSVTSSLSFIRNATWGTLMFASGWLIESGGGHRYDLVFIMAGTACTAGLICVLAWTRWLSKAQARVSGHIETVH